MKKGIDLWREIDLMLSGNQFTHETVSMLLPQSNKACLLLSFYFIYHCKNTLQYRAHLSSMLLSYRTKWNNNLCSFLCCSTDMSNDKCVLDWESRNPLMHAKGCTVLLDPPKTRSVFVHTHTHTQTLHDFIISPKVLGKIYIKDNDKTH